MLFRENYLDLEFNKLQKNYSLQQKKEFACKLCANSFFYLLKSRENKRFALPCPTLYDLFPGM